MLCYSNFYSFEGEVTGLKTIELGIRPRELIITNDSAVGDLKYKFAVFENYATLKPTETVSLHIIVNKVYLSSSLTIPYRIWGYG
jgi:hypothetical protein